MKQVILFSTGDDWKARYIPASASAGWLRALHHQHNMFLSILPVLLYVCLRKFEESSLLVWNFSSTPCWSDKITAVRLSPGYSLPLGRWCLSTQLKKEQDFFNFWNRGMVKSWCVLRQTTVPNANFHFGGSDYFERKIYYLLSTWKKKNEKVNLEGEAFTTIYSNWRKRKNPVKAHRHDHMGLAHCI